MCSYQMPLASPTPAALMTPPFYTHAAAAAAAGSPSSTSISRSSSPDSAVYLDAAHETILKSFAPPMSVSAAAYYQQQQHRHTAWTPVSSHSQSHSHSRASSIDSSCSSSPDMLSPSTTARSCSSSASHTMPPHMVQLAHAYAVHQLPNGHYLYVPTLISFHMTAPAALGVAPVVVASPAPVAVAVAAPASIVAPAPIAAPIPQRAASATPSDESDFEFKYDDEPSAHDAASEAVQATASSTFAAALQANLPRPLLEKELTQSAAATPATPVSTVESGVTVYSATMHRRAASLLRLASAPITRSSSPSPAPSMSSSSSASSPSSCSSSIQLSPSPTMPIRFRKVPVLDDETMSMVMERARSNAASPCLSALRL